LGQPDHGRRRHIDPPRSDGRLLRGGPLAPRARRASPLWSGRERQRLRRSDGSAGCFWIARRRLRGSSNGHVAHELGSFSSNRGA
jgi:hypothetical protein